MESDAGREELCGDGAVSIREAVGFTGISRAELYRRMGKGSLPSIVIGRRRLLPRRALVALLASGLKATS